MTMTSEVIRDEDGLIDWKANGWPEPNPYGEGDTSTMPYEGLVWIEWADVCDLLEWMWEEG